MIIFYVLSTLALLVFALGLADTIRRVDEGDEARPAREFPRGGIHSEWPETLTELAPSATSLTPPLPALRPIYAELVTLFKFDPLEVT